MKVAAIQFKADKGRPDESLDRLCALVEQAGSAGARLIVCPEMALTGYLFPDAASARAIAEPLHGPSSERLAGLARRHGCFLVQGFAERAGGPEQGAGTPLYNSARVFGPDGSLVYRYQKRLLFDADYTWAAAGTTPYPLIETEHGTLTVGICMDLNDDRFTAFLRATRPRLVAFCTNWVDEGLDVRPYWQLRLRGCTSYFVAANTYGREEAQNHAPTAFSGHSAILAPDGRTLSRGPKEGDAVVLAELPDLAPAAAAGPGSA